MVKICATAPATAPRESSIAVLGGLGRVCEEIYRVRTTEYQ